MYSRSKVNARLEMAASEFGIVPEVHTVEEVTAFDDHLRRQGMYVYNDSGAPASVQSLTQFERDWMLNEQVLVMSDADYFLTRYAYIKDEQNNIHRFSFRIPQRLLFEIISDLESRDSAIELLILKARQLGMSTIVELLIGHRIIFGYGVNAIIGSADQTKTALMANMLFLMYDYLPVWLRPQWTRRVESDRGMLVFGHSASGVSFQHGSQASGIARGTTPTIYHLSEVASFTDPVNQIEASLFKAVHASPNVFGVLETTGEGDKGWLPDTWRHAKANWQYNRARLCATFLPWFCGTDIYPTPTWIRMRPVPEGWHPNHDTREHVAKSELYVRSNPLLGKHLGSGWRMPREQQWFWEVEHEQAKAKGIEPVFLQEMAGDDEEALQRSATSVFGHQTILEIDTRRERQYDAYAIAGQSIEEDHEPPEDCIDYAKERIPVRYQSLKGDVYRWELIPLQFQPPLREDIVDDATGILFVWHHPQSGVDYSVGVDTSEGKGEDSTVISVWAIGRGDSPDVQVAEYASSYVSHVEAFAFVLAIAAYYKSTMDPSRLLTKWSEPYVSIEQVAAVGDVAQLQMAKMGYHNFHMMSRYDSKNVGKSKRQAKKRGWFTWGWSRPILTGNFVHWTKNMWAQVNSPWLLEEMKQFEVKVTASGKEKMEHEEGAHDDRIFAAAMAVFCPHDLEPMAQRSKKRSVDPTTLPPLDLTPYQPNTFTSKQRAQTDVVTLEDLTYAESQMERYR
jgi:hypothetical protein